MLGNVGNDKYGKFTIDSLKDENVDTRLIELLDKYPSTKIICALLNKERSFLSDVQASLYISLDFCLKNQVKLNLN